MKHVIYSNTKYIAAVDFHLYDRFNGLFWSRKTGNFQVKYNFQVRSEIPVRYYAIEFVNALPFKIIQQELECSSLVLQNFCIIISQVDKVWE